VLLPLQVQEQTMFAIDQEKVQGYIKQRKEAVEQATVHTLPPAKGDEVWCLV
jgi:hypothetical protein